VPKDDDTEGEGEKKKDLKFKQGQKRLVQRSEKRSSVSTEFGKAATETQQEKKLPMQKLPDTPATIDSKAMAASVGRPDSHTTQKTPFP
jgi:hypothetical protein